MTLMHAAQRLFADGHADGTAEVDGLHAANHAVSGFHGHGADAAFAQVLLDLENYGNGRGHGEAVAGDAQRLIDGRHGRFFKLDVYGGAGDLDYFADVFCHCSLPSLLNKLNLELFLRLHYARLREFSFA